jgi:nicotinamide mononucleotide transporter
VDFFANLLNAQITFGEGQHILWREVVGNLFGLASAVGGMRRRVWAWPVGIVGNVLLFTIFLGGVFATPQGANLLGQAGRQVMFAGVSVYGWYRWRQARAGAPAVVPRWATWRERLAMAAAAAVGVGLLTPLFTALGSFEPVWADAWIFMGSLLATYGMARGWTDFWLVWLLVDVVGVPLLLRAQLYPSAVLYLVYGGFVIWGFAVWRRAQRRETPTDAGRPDSPAVETVG